MSLINEAIKKANQANKDNRAQQPAPENAAVPVAGMKEAANATPPVAGGMTGMFIIAGIVIFVLLGGFLMVIGLKNRGSTNSTQNTDKAQPIVTPEHSVAVQTQPASSQQNDVTSFFNNSPTTVAARVTNDSPTNSESKKVATTDDAKQPAPAVPVQPAGPPPFPALKLQGIFYRLNDPSVMINGETLWEGDDIEGVTVIKIERSVVTLDFNGETRQLKLR